MYVCVYVWGRRVVAWQPRWACGQAFPKERPSLSKGVPCAANCFLSQAHCLPMGCWRSVSNGIPGDLPVWREVCLVPCSSKLNSLIRLRPASLTLPSHCAAHYSYPENSDNRNHALGEELQGQRAFDVNARRPKTVVNKLRT